MVLHLFRHWSRHRLVRIPLPLTAPGALGANVAFERDTWLAVFLQALADQPLPCPACGAPLQSRGEHPRGLLTQAGQEITLTRSYGTCSACGAGLFPPR